MSTRTLIVIAAGLFACASGRAPNAAAPADLADQPALDTTPPEPGPDTIADPVCLTSSDCAAPLGDGSCPPAGASGERQIPTLQGAGTICYCQAGQCVKDDIAPAACRRDNECGIEERHDFEVPVRLLKPRRHKLKPCAGDGSHIPACENGFCTIRVYGC